MLIIEHRDKPLTVNEIGSSRDHWKRSKEIAKWRDAFKWLALARRDLTINPPVEVRVHHYVAKKVGRGWDLGSPFYSAKGGIDGLVDAKLLPDDSTKYVQRLTFLPFEVVGYDGIGLELIEL